MKKWTKSSQAYIQFLLIPQAQIFRSTCALSHRFFPCGRAVRWRRRCSSRHTGRKRLTYPTSCKVRRGPNQHVDGQRRLGYLSVKLSRGMSQSELLLGVAQWRERMICSTSRPGRTWRAAWLELRAVVQQVTHRRIGVLTMFCTVLFNRALHSPDAST